MVQRTNGKQGLATVLGGWVVRYRWWIIVATVLTVTLISSGMRFLTFTMDNRIFFSEDNPQLAALEALENTYVKTYNVVFVVEPESGDVFELSYQEGEAIWRLERIFLG